MNKKVVEKIKSQIYSEIDVVFNDEKELEISIPDNVMNPIIERAVETFSKINLETDDTNETVVEKFKSQVYSEIDIVFNSLWFNDKKELEISITDEVNHSITEMLFKTTLNINDETNGRKGVYIFDEVLMFYIGVEVYYVSWRIMKNFINLINKQCKLNIDIKRTKFLKLRYNNRLIFLAFYNLKYRYPFGKKSSPSSLQCQNTQFLYGNTTKFDDYYENYIAKYVLEKMYAMYFGKEQEGNKYYKIFKDL